MKISKEQQNYIVSQLKEFRNSSDILKDLKDHEIADSILWSKQRFSKAINGYSKTDAITLSEIFIEKYGAPAEFFNFKLANSKVLSEYTALQENYNLLNEIYEKTVVLNRQQLQLHEVRTSKLKELVNTPQFREALKKEKEKKDGVLNQLLRIFALNISDD